MSAEDEQPIRKAVAPDLEKPTPVPEEIAGKPGVVIEHDEERLAEETLLYARLLAHGWVPVNISECVLHDRWRHPLFGERDALAALSLVGPTPSFDEEIQSLQNRRGADWDGTPPSIRDVLDAEGGGEA